MTQQLLIAGGGMGGLAAAIAAARAGWHARLFEQAPAFAEVGAGIQLGPNATRILQAWDLGPGLAQVASFPGWLEVRSAGTGALLGRMRLGTSFVERYGAPYATVHRADLHGLLLRGAQSAGTALHIDARVATFRETADAIRLQVASQTEIEGDALVGADGLWSEVRKYLRPGAMPRPVGHLAYRALLAQHALPASLRSAGVTVWLGARLHVVAYPVRQDAGLNVVAIVDGALAGDGAGWDHAGSAADLQRAMGSVCNPLRELVQAASSWRLWVLNECDSVTGPEAMARGRLALLGDAAHPMRPYLAQGAGMAIEDAQELGRCLALERDKLVDVPVALQRYALNRWERVARVQRRAQRNGWIFHATGPVRWGRDAALRLLGERLLDLPWLYGHGQI